MRGSHFDVGLCYAIALRPQTRKGPRDGRDLKKAPRRRDDEQPVLLDRCAQNGDEHTDGAEEDGNRDAERQVVADPREKKGDGGDQATDDPQNGHVSLPNGPRHEVRPVVRGQNAGRDGLRVVGDGLRTCGDHPDEPFAEEEDDLF